MAPLDGRKLELAAGTAELTFARGARIVIQGPATLEVLSANEMQLDRGKLAASVPGPAIGFAVLTPTAAVVDLGTEFGVEVDEAGATNLTVLRGLWTFPSARTAPPRLAAARPCGFLQARR